MPALQNELPAGQRNQLEAAVLERTKQLNRLFEDQIKKQYEAMRREVSKLAKAHQKDVQALDQRFKAKIAGLASRFKQLEEEEEKMEMVKKENEDLQTEIGKMTGLMEEQDRRNEASLATIVERDASIEQLQKNLKRINEAQEALQQEMAQRTAQANAIQKELERNIESLEKTIAKKKADLKEMQQRLVSAKSSFDTEVVRKQSEVTELEASMRQLQDYTKRMHTFTTQVQGQIMTREQDMKVQLGLMKNTIAFALYIDETLTVDLTDPHDTQLLQKPMTVYPSGVTYSSATIEKIQEAAAKDGVPPRCPQTGEEIAYVAPNHVVESILSRYLFKQQITKDVMFALNEYQTKTPAGEEDQPLEMYLQRMKASMVERLETMHADAMLKSQYSFQQQIDQKDLEADKRNGELEKRMAELEELRSEYSAAKKQTIAETAAFEDQVAELRTRVREGEEERDTLKAKREELLHRVTRLTSKLSRLEEGAEDDADALDDETTNLKLQKVRKADLLALRAELEDKSALLEELTKTLAERDAEIARLREELGNLRRELAGEKRATQSLTDERAALQSTVKRLERDCAATASDLTKSKEAVSKLEVDYKESNEQAKSLLFKLTEANLKVEQLLKDADKLRTRLASKEELARSAADENAQLQAKIEEMIGESGRKDRGLTMARQTALEEKQKSLELEQQVKWLEEDKARLEGVLAKRQEENGVLVLRATTAEATAQMLSTKLDQMGAKDAEATLQMRPLGDIQKTAGVFDPLKELPNVPVLGQLYETIDRTQNNLLTLTARDGHLATMAKIEVLKIDQTLPPDEGKLVSSEPVPLPYPPVLMRQFTPPPEGLRPPSPPPPEDSSGIASVVAGSSKGAGSSSDGAGGPSGYGGAASGAGTMVLPEQS